jgi:hypothetical protein
MARHFTIIALSALMLAAPAAANKTSPKNGAKPERIYCIQYEPQSGSRIAQKECNTKSHWARMGIDIEKMMGK